MSWIDGVAEFVARVLQRRQRERPSALAPAPSVAGPGRRRRPDPDVQSDHPRHDTRDGAHGASRGCECSLFPPPPPFPSRCLVLTEKGQLAGYRARLEAASTSKTAISSKAAARKEAPNYDTNVHIKWIETITQLLEAGANVAISLPTFVLVVFPCEVFVLLPSLTLFLRA